MPRIKNDGLSNRRAKIVCTLGPATSTYEMVYELIDAGMNVARLNIVTVTTPPTSNAWIL